MPDELLNPAKSWTGQADFKEEVTKLGGLFVENFKKYADQATSDVIKAGPEVRTVNGANQATSGVKEADPEAPSVNGANHATQEVNKAGSEAPNVNGE